MVKTERALGKEDELQMRCISDSVDLHLAHLEVKLGSTSTSDHLTGNIPHK